MGENQLICGAVFQWEPVNATKWRWSARNIEILFRTLSQLRQFVVEVGLVPKVCVVKRGGIIEDNSKMLGNFYFSDCSYEPGQD